MQGRLPVFRNGSKNHGLTVMGPAKGQSMSRNLYFLSLFAIHGKKARAGIRSAIWIKAQDRVPLSFGRKDDIIHDPIIAIIDNLLTRCRVFSPHIGIEDVVSKFDAPGFQFIRWVRLLKPNMDIGRREGPAQDMIPFIRRQDALCVKGKPQIGLYRNHHDGNFYRPVRL